MGQQEQDAGALGQQEQEQQYQDRSSSRSIGGSRSSIAGQEAGALGFEKDDTKM
jgi:hypothetical protein